jgi:hypothetical protein
MESPGDLLFPWPDGRMRSPEADPQKILRTALARAGLVDGYDHTAVDAGRAARCTSSGTATSPRRCPHCGMSLWPRALPRPLRFHDLRHTTATLLLRAGVDPHRVQRIMRHRDLRTTLGTYGHLDVEDLRAAVASLPSDVGGSAPRGREARAERALRALVTRLLPALTDPERTKGRSPGFPLRHPALQMEREKGFERS